MKAPTVTCGPFDAQAGINPSGTSPKCPFDYQGSFFHEHPSAILPRNSSPKPYLETETLYRGLFWGGSRIWAFAFRAGFRSSEVMLGLYLLSSPRSLQPLPGIGQRLRSPPRRRRLLTTYYLLLTTTTTTTTASTTATTYHC